MKNSKNGFSNAKNAAPFGLNYFVAAFISIWAVAATFFVAVSTLDIQTKKIIFSALLVSYPVLYAAFFIGQKRRAVRLNKINSEAGFDAEIETKLLALDEANQFFGASLKPADMFRFAASRIGEIIPFTTAALFLANEERTNLTAAFVVGENANEFTNLQIDINTGLAGKTFQSGRAKIDDLLLWEKKTISDEAAKKFNSAIAVPLFRGAAAFGTLILYHQKKNEFDSSALIKIEAIGVRVAALFLSSLAFENSLSNALTDALTNLPNERAFFLVLENQIAQSQRFRDQRPLTILTIDIKNFGELNQRFGHSAGDRILEYAALNVKNQLRQMDFLARSVNDEFLAVLPTASDDITCEIIERIEKAFVSNPYAVNKDEKLHLKLNFGTASFWKDGETVEQLTKHARLRKQQFKKTENSNVLWFPKEFVN